ncbi:MAG TPA: DUF3631 domain-containing protein [Mycobacterium sp.]|nr:DUF3631 domain-containing protein [Mycobacterium sp.]
MCRALVAAADSADEDKALGVKLLVDIRQVLAEKNVPFLPSTEWVRSYGASRSRSGTRSS